MSGLARPTFANSLDTLEMRGLIWVTGDTRSYNVHLCDPYTGEPLHEQTGIDEDDLANYYVKGESGQAKRLNLNTGNPEQIERLIRSCLPDDEVPIIQGNGNLMIRCRFHPDRNPSCSVSPTKHGCFHCFGCGKDGSLSTLIMQLRNVSRGEAIQTMADAIGAKIEYHKPDKNAIAIYSYRDENGKLLKQVLRYPPKVFMQRRPGKGGDWIWNTDDLPPILFNMDLLQYAGTVCITEGEQDAQTVTDLHLTGNGGLMVGMTSGGANSWDGQLAKHLRDKQVVLMPDADEAGARFAEAVKKSLEAEGIEYREVGFADAGAKDVTEFLESHSVEELVRRIGTDWVRMPNGQIVKDNLADVDLFSFAETDLQNQITL